MTVGRVYGDCSTTQPAICVWRTHLHRRERGGGNGYVRRARQPNHRAAPINLCGCGYGSELTRDPRATRGAAAIMSKYKRGFGEHSTNEAPFAPKLHKRLHRCCRAAM